MDSRSKRKTLQDDWQFSFSLATRVNYEIIFIHLPVDRKGFRFICRIWKIAIKSLPHCKRDSRE